MSCVRSCGVPLENGGLVDPLRASRSSWPPRGPTMAIHATRAGPRAFVRGRRRVAARPTRNRSAAFPMKLMSDRIDEIASGLEEVSNETRAAFGGLSDDQLNWKPAEGSWSVAQCLDHLVTINSLYFPLFESMNAGPLKPTFWERYSPLSGFFGRFLIRTSSPEYSKKMKTSPKAEPSMSEVDGEILDRFARHQAELIEHLRRIPSGIDPVRTIVTSPLLGFVNYSLDDCLTLLEVHERRHFQQARRVTETAGFPTSA